MTASGTAGAVTDGAVTEHAGRGPVVGDGTSLRTRTGSRWRRWRGPLAVLALLALVGLLAALPEPRTSSTPFAPDGAGPTGARAVAQILERRGVDVRYVRSADSAATLATRDSTLLVVGGIFLDDERLDMLRDTDADLVLVGYAGAVERLTDGRVVAGSGLGPGSPARTAGCDDPDATAAGTVTATGALRATDPAVVVCFPADDAAHDPAEGSYLVVPGPRRVTALTDTGLLTNARLADEGNAALVLRALGRHPRLVWYLPSLDDTGAGGGGPALTDLVPPRLALVGLALLPAVLVTALWRGRRLGRLVTEPLPVVVRAGETTRGRGRLYRRSRAYGHAAAALRAGAASRCARRLGISRTAPHDVLVDALSRACGREPDLVERLLYGPPPRDDAGLAQLALDLDHLESEVHRP